MLRKAAWSAGLGRFLIFHDLDEQFEKTSKTHKKLKERFLIGRNRTKRANFRGNPLFQATYDIKTEKPKRKPQTKEKEKTKTKTTTKKQQKNKQLIQLILCQLDGRRRAEGKGHETDSKCFEFFFQNAASQLCFRLV